MNVRIAFLLWVGVSILLIVLLVTIWAVPEPPPQPTDRPPLPAEWAADPAQRSADAARSAGMLTARFLQMSIPVGILVVAIRMRTGSNWARIALTVIGIGLALLILVNTVTNLASAGAAIGDYFIVRLLISVGLLPLLAGAVILMFRPRVSGFFS
ncbi:MAG: hypothetical protein ACRDRR_21805 [Pseudonocardiaceae bacterium]